MDRGELLLLVRPSLKQGSQNITTLECITCLASRLTMLKPSKGVNYNATAWQQNSNTEQGEQEGPAGRLVHDPECHAEKLKS